MHSEAVELGKLSIQLDRRLGGRDALVAKLARH